VKKPVLYILFLFAIAVQASAQKVAPSDLRILHKKEDSLKTIVKSVMIDSFTAGRMRSDSQFIKTLVRSLQVKNSFYYPFDSIKGIGKLYAPDSTFRIITWQLAFDDYYCRQRGAIQFRTPDGSLRLVPLRDYSEFAQNPQDSVRSKDTWIGAVYYNMIKTEYNGKNYYTLFGFDQNSVQSNKKWIEVLTFNDKNLPVFGGKYFSFDKDSIRKPTQYRYSIEYKKDASTTVNFDPELNMILVDHLISESDEPELAYTFVPDGDYEGFKWVNGKWLHVDKVFSETVDMKGADMYLGKPPMGDPLLDKDGNRDEKKLEEKSNKNKTKGKKDDD
jgi:hypothetical protein